MNLLDFSVYVLSCFQKKALLQNCFMKLWNLYEYFVSKNVWNFIHKTVFVKMSEDFDRENYLFIIWASIYNELRDGCSTSERRLLRQQQNMHALWYSHECTPKTDTEENKMLNKVIIVSFVHKKYSRSFLKWGWTTDVTLTILMMLSGPWTWWLRCCQWRDRKLSDLIRITYIWIWNDMRVRN